MDTIESIGELESSSRCPLCKQRRKLCVSHIIPEFMYRPAYDEKRRSLSLDSKTGRRRLIQRGYAEPILCQGCEGYLNRMYENPVYQAWYGDSLLPGSPPDGRWTLLSGLNYPVVKLFHLSILWRASIASAEAFAAVDLGPHEETIRRMIRHDEPGEPEEFPVMAVALTMDEGLAHGMVMSPAVREYKGKRIYSMIYGGFEWSIGVGTDWPPAVGRIALQKDGSIRLGVEEWSESLPVRLFATKHGIRRDDLKE